MIKSRAFKVLFTYREGSYTSKLNKARVATCQLNNFFKVGKFQYCEHINLAGKRSINQTSACTFTLFIEKQQNVLKMYVCSLTLARLSRQIDRNCRK